MCGECAPRWGRLSPQFGRAPLQWASRRGHVDVVRLLLDHGASMDATSSVSQPACLAAPPSTLHGAAGIIYCAITGPGRGGRSVAG